MYVRDGSDFHVLSGSRWLGKSQSSYQGGREFSLPDLETESARTMPRSKGLPRFKTRREAEVALAEIIEDGGVLTDFRIDELPDGGCVITILEKDGHSVAGTLSV